LQAEGALVDILAGWSAARIQQLRVALRPVPPPVHARAVLDTGAEITCLDAALIHALGLPSGGTVLANVPAQGGLTLAALHDASITLIHPSGNARDNLVVRNLSVLELSLASFGYEALLGRDLLAICHFLLQRAEKGVPPGLLNNAYGIFLPDQQGLAGN
jgi:hypothetical protein